MKIRTLHLALVAALTAPAVALAAGTHGDGHGHGPAMGAMHQDMHANAGMAAHGTSAGKPGDPARIDRTMLIEMSDAMQFTPAQVDVKAGETIRFFIVNKGQVPHEMVIGTRAELDEHAEMMRRMPGMQHEEPNQIKLAAGQRGGIVWNFDKPGSFDFACLLPGHREAGMVGKIAVN